METIEGTISPEQLEFAQRIAKELNKLDHGDYQTIDQERTIVLCEEIIDNGKKSYTPTRINNKTGIMELNQVVMGDYHENTVLFFILWSWFKFPYVMTDAVEVPISGLASDQETDEITADYILENKLMSIEQIVLSFIEGLQHVTTDHNVNRIEKLKNYLDEN